MMFERFDTDGDGEVTRAEAEGYVDGRLGAFDADGSGE